MYNGHHRIAKRVTTSEKQFKHKQRFYKNNIITCEIIDI